MNVHGSVNYIYTVCLFTDYRDHCFPCALFVIVEKAKYIKIDHKRWIIHDDKKFPLNKVAKKP